MKSKDYLKKTLSMLSIITLTATMVGCNEDDSIKQSNLAPLNTEHKQQSKSMKDSMEFLPYQELTNHYKASSVYADKMSELLNLTVKEQEGTLTDEEKKKLEQNKNNIGALSQQAIDEMIKQGVSPEEAKKREQLLREAMSWKEAGTTYSNAMNPKKGGKSGRNCGGSWCGEGVDCSGLVREVYKTIGMDLSKDYNSTIAMELSLLWAKEWPQGSGFSRLNRAKQKKQLGVKFYDPKLLKPGDLIAMKSIGSSSQYIDHIGLYVGDNKIVHSTHGGTWEGKAVNGVVMMPIVEVGEGQASSYTRMIKEGSGKGTRWYVNLFAKPDPNAKL